MTHIKSYIYKNKVLILIFTVSLFYVLVATKAQNEKVDVSKTGSETVTAKTKQTSQNLIKYKTLKESSSPSKNSKDKTTTTLKNIKDLAENFPQSKPQFLSIITADDPFSSEKNSLNAHSEDELLQRKLGAVKILALRKLVELEKDPASLKNDLVSISRNAKDPTIAKIARAVLQSSKQNRSFFEDFRNGINTDLPL